ncbi:MAG TPA: hypothetical protein VIJ15_10025 [Dermatophilaceae bacterium]
MSLFLITGGMALGLGLAIWGIQSGRGPTSDDERPASISALLLVLVAAAMVFLLFALAFAPPGDVSLTGDPSYSKRILCIVLGLAAAIGGVVGYITAPRWFGLIAAGISGAALLTGIALIL